MTAQPVTAQSDQTLSQQACFSSDASVLADIIQPETNLCVWQRELDKALTDEISQLVHNWPSLKVQETGSSDELQKILLQRLGQPYSALIRDVALLADMMQMLFDEPHVGLRMTVLNQAMCPRYHLDRLQARLITTYAGPGMQWLSNDAVERTSAGPLTLTPDSELEHRQLSAGDVALCKGDNWPRQSGNGLIHRSPAVPAGTARLLVTLDLC